MQIYKPAEHLLSVFPPAKERIEAESCIIRIGESAKLTSNLQGQLYTLQAVTQLKPFWCFPVSGIPHLPCVISPIDLIDAHSLSEAILTHFRGFPGGIPHQPCAI